MTNFEQNRFNVLCKMHGADMTDAEWLEFLEFSDKIKAEYDTANLNFFENYFFEE